MEAMSDSLGPIQATRKTGNELFVGGGAAPDFDLLGFWQWSASDLISNATRGVLAEYIVARALGMGHDGVREEWAPHDLTTPDGIHIEVKSAAYVQSWSQRRLSPISFGYRATLKWDPETNRKGTKGVHTAHVFVFALFHCQDKQAANPMDLDQWEFYVVSTVDLDRRKRSQHSISLKSLKSEFGGSCNYVELSDRVRAEYERTRNLGAFLPNS